MNFFIFERRFFNRYTLITVIALFLTLAVSWFFVSGVAEILFMDYGHYTLGGGDPAQIRAENMPIFLQGAMSWELLLMSAMAYIINFLPLFFILPTVVFAKEKNSYFVFGRHRFKSFSRSLFGAICQHALIAAVISFCTFVLFYGIVGLFVTPELDGMTEFARRLSDILWVDHPFLFVIFTFGTVYFALAFIFAFISCGVMLWVDNPYYAISGIVVANYLYFYVGGYLDYFLNLNFNLFWMGNTVVAFNTWRTTTQVFIPFIPITIVGIVIVYLGIKRQEKNVNV